MFVPSDFIASLTIYRFCSNLSSHPLINPPFLLPSLTLPAVSVRAFYIIVFADFIH